MRGHLKKRYLNSWSIVLDLGRDPLTGKRKQKWYSVKGTRKEAEKRLSELLTRADAGTLTTNPRISVGDYLLRWLGDYAAVNLAPRTVEGYESIVRVHLIPLLGNIQLAKLTPIHLNEYYNRKVKTLSNTTVHHHHTLIHKTLQTAIEWWLLTTNPAAAATPPKPEKRDMQFWSQSEMVVFLEALKNTPYYSLFYTALFTGVRRSELLALRWMDIDFILGQIYITRGLHRLRTGELVFRLPKTAKGKRSIAMSPSLFMVLKKVREEQEAAGILLNHPVKEDGLVFCNHEWGPLLPGSITHAWVRLVKKAGVKPIRLHDARHTHASLLLKQGVHPKIVQERLGHSSIQITLDTYSHVAPGLQEAAAVKFDELIPSVS